MEQAKTSAGKWALLTVALGLHLVAGMFILTSGLVAPFPAVALLLLIWAGLGVVGLRNRHRPVVALMMPVAAAAAWFVVVQGGSMLFGWTA
ncbi:MAG TPA: hypothetical protein VHL54_12610 [Actinomycetota bacterium]|nr:hypothetical protein [Actinomycetota bacterium]